MKKALARTVAVAALVAAGVGFSAGTDPASARCADEPEDRQVVLDSTVAGVPDTTVGLDDGSSGEVGVVWVCAWQLDVPSPV